MSSYGETGQAAAQIAVEDVNAYFARAGIPYQIQVLVEDSATDPAAALTALQKFANQGIQIVIGPYASSTVAGVKDFADQNDILILSPASSSVSLSIAGDNIYRMVADDSNQGLAIAHYLAGVGKKRLIPVFMDDSFGNSLYESTRRAFETLESVCEDGIPFPPETNNFDALLQTINARVESAIAQEGADAVAVHLIAFEQTVQLFQLAKNYPALAGVLWIGNDGITENQRLLENADAAAFAVRAGFVSPILRMDDTSTVVIPSFPFTQHFMQRMRAKIGRNGDEFSIHVYDAIWLSALAASRSGNSTDLNTLKSSLAEASIIYIGYFARIVWNAAGDRDVGTYGFYSVKETAANAYDWINVGSFRFRSGRPQGQVPLRLTGVEIPADLPNLNIAALLPLSGELSGAGQSAQRILEISANNLNSYLQAEGVAGRISLTIEDTQTDPAVTLHKLQQIAASDSARIVIGPFDSASVAAVKEFVDSEGLIVISPASTASSLSVPDHIYRLILDNAKQAQALVGLMRQEMVRAVIPVWRNDTYGNDLQSQLRDKMLAADGVVLEGVRYDPNTTDFSSLIQTLNDQVNSARQQFGDKFVAVVLFSYEEAKDIFISAFDQERLRSLRWYGCDANARLASVLSDPRAQDFAVAA
ncbi:MAG: hypothetical protein C4527_09875, partial [Candidatus Omnitrophota bacterium]